MNRSSARLYGFLSRLQPTPRLPPALKRVADRESAGSRLRNLLAILAAWLPISFCWADDRPPDGIEGRAGGRSSLATLDVSYVLRSYSVFQRRKEEIDAGKELAESVIRRQQQELYELSQRLKYLQAGSREHTELDLAILGRTKDLQTRSEAARKKFSAAQLRAHVTAYEEMVRVVNQYLKETDYQAVLRKNSPSVEIAEEHKEPAHAVVFAQGAVDISREIVQRLNGTRQKTADRMRQEARR